MGKISARTTNYKIYLPQEVKVPTLISPAGDSENYIFLPTENIYFEAEIFLYSYDGTSAILDGTTVPFFIINEFSFIIAGNDRLGYQNLTPGTFVIYNGTRGVSLSYYYASSNTIDLNIWTKIIAQRINSNWLISINEINQKVLRIKDGSPTDQFDNINLPIYIGRFGSDGTYFNGKIRNVILLENGNQS